MAKYRVNIDPNTSFDFEVEAKNVHEAKEKAWEKFMKKKRRKKDCKIYCDKTD